MATDAQILKETPETGLVFLTCIISVDDEVDRQASAFETAQQPKLGNVRDSANESYLGKRKYVQCLRRPDTKSAEDNRASTDNCRHRTHTVTQTLAVWVCGL